MRTLRSLLVCGSLGIAIAPAAVADLTLFEHDGYRGREFVVAQEVLDLKRAGFNDTASSVIVRDGRWQLCADSNFRGQCITLEPGEYPSMSAYKLNDRISSTRRLDGQHHGSSGSSVSSAATSACMMAVNGNYGGNVRDLRVVRSEWSQANSEVIMEAIGVRGGSQTERWRCLVSNEGNVQELSVLSGR
jgi:hypothetical protein